MKPLLILQKPKSRSSKRKAEKEYEELVAKSQYLELNFGNDLFESEYDYDRIFSHYIKAWCHICDKYSKNQFVVLNRDYFNYAYKSVV